MSTRTLLCLCPGHTDQPLPNAIAQAGWRVDSADDFESARTKLNDCEYSTALFISEYVDKSIYEHFKSLQRVARPPEWVGAFSCATLSGPYVNELIVNHLFDFHTLPVDIDRLIHSIGHAHGVHLLREKMQALADASVDDTLMIGQSAAMKKLQREIRKTANVDAPVMISGASGSGKELAAQAIHQLSRRKEGPFIAVNCSALPGTLIQSELFGHEKGAFSGAIREKKGFLEAAAGGTIFLDEIGDIPLDLQTNLLRFLQEKTISRIGSTQLIHVDTRVIAASHVDIEKAVADGRFREDLYYRLNVLPLHVPPLAERREDIPLLAEHFFTQFKQESCGRLRGFGSSALRAMATHPWPGNVRELLNRVRRAIVMAEGRLITAADLGLERRATGNVFRVLTDARSDAEKEAILVSLSNARNNISLAARALGISRMTLYRLLEKHRIGV